MSKAQLLEKSLSALITALMFLLATPTQFGHCVIVLGQAHCLATYYFQYRAGKVTPLYLLRYVLAFSLILSSYIHYPNYEMLKNITLIWFGLHAIFDELFLLQSKPSAARTLTALALFSLYTYYALIDASTVSINADACLLPAILLAAAYIFRKRSGEPLSGIDWYLYAGIALLVLIPSISRMTDWKIFGLMAIFHYTNWYLNNYFRFQDNAPRLRHFVTASLAINAVILAGFALYRYVPDASVLKYIYSPTAFLLWTLLHLFVTIRLQDKMHLRPLWKGAL